MFDNGPQALRQLEFIKIHFELEFLEALHLPPGALLRLRRELRQVARLLDNVQDRAAFSTLFDPPVPADPVARKRIQRPGPGFVIRGLPLRERDFEAGDSLEMTVLFWGTASHSLADFVAVLQGLGRSGLVHGQGAFEVSAISAEDASAEKQTLWVLGDEMNELDGLAPPVLDAWWWVECAETVSPSSLELHFLTPARLMSGGRPLFSPTFGDIFTFILRRVTSMAQAHCALELVGEPQPLIEIANQLHESANSLRWTDWRRLEAESRSQDLGGISGSLCLDGESLQEIFWILRLGSLLQLGKGAAYGSGRYDLRITS